MAESSRPTILVVDDDEIQRIILNKLLTARNYSLLFARDGFEALNVLKNKHPNLILMDIMMPNMNGMEATRQLKTNPEFAGIPVIMITGKSEGEVVNDCMKAGAVDFVVKPYEHATLLAKIDHALKAAVLA
jgi:CheY-like chemotaxis protein